MSKSEWFPTGVNYFQELKLSALLFDVLRILITHGKNLLRKSYINVDWHVYGIKNTINIPWLKFKVSNIHRMNDLL